MCKTMHGNVLTYVKHSIAFDLTVDKIFLTTSFSDDQTREVINCNAQVLGDKWIDEEGHNRSIGRWFQVGDDDQTCRSDVAVLITPATETLPVVLAYDNGYFELRIPILPDQFSAAKGAIGRKQINSMSITLESTLFVTGQSPRFGSLLLLDPDTLTASCALQCLYFVETQTIGDE